jgi:hypothetical protein
MILWIVIYLLIGGFCVYHMTGKDVKRHPNLFNNRVDSIECMGLKVTLGFILLWPFGLDFIFFDK